jgi:hypothetical protein
MKIYIPTLGRAEQKTAACLHLAEVPFTWVLGPGPSALEGDWTKEYPVMNCQVPTIGAKRQFILDNTDDPMTVMLDDDLTFYVAPHDKAGNVLTQVRAHHRDVKRMFKDLKKYLREYAHGSVADKIYLHSRPYPIHLNQRYLHVLAYNLDLFPTPRPRFRTDISAEHDMNLQLLKAGRDSFMMTGYAQHDEPNAPGGCSIYRTLKVLNDDCYKLAGLHPDVITVVPKPDDTIHLRIQWSKAASMGRMLNT